MNLSRVSPEEQAVLAKMMTGYGVYEVVKALQEIARKECEERFFDNREAIIHSDEENLRIALQSMRDAHPMRRLADMD